MMHNAVDSSQGRHGIFEDAIPLSKDQIRGNHHGFAFIALGQKGEEYFHLATVLLDIANILEDNTGEAIEHGESLWEA